MKAVILRAFNQPLELGEVVEPTPGNREVLVAIEAAGVCYKDVLIGDGFQPRVKLPMVLGHEGAGRIVALGEGVAGFSVGDRVCSLGYVPCGECAACRSGAENVCRTRQWLGEDRPGAYAERVSFHVNALAKIPDSVSAEDAAAATCALSTSVHGLRGLGKLQSGQTVLVTGAAGAVGTSAVQVARAMGARVIGCDLPEKLGHIQAAGADAALPFDGQLASQVKELTSGQGVDVVLDTVGTASFEQSLKILSWGGRMVVVGNLAPAETVRLSLGPLILRQIAILGCMNGRREDLSLALTLLSDGKLTLPPPTILPLGEAPQAHRLLRERRSVGKIFLKP